MTLPNNTHVSGAAGTTFPTHLVGTNEYPIGMTADADGHIEGSLPAYGLVIPPAAAAAGKVYFDMFNAQAATTLRLRKLFAVVATDVAVTGIVGVRLDIMRTNSVGTGGTAATQTAGNTSKTVPSFWSFNPNQAALPSGVTSRVAPTAGAADHAWLWNNYVFTEETNVSSQVTQFYNLLPELPHNQAIELPTNYGLKAVQGSVASVGSIGFLVIFTVE